MTAPPMTERIHSPGSPYGVKGEWIRHDVLALIPPNARRILSIGCGTGATESLLRQRGIEVWGIDISEESIAAARERLDRADVADVESDDLPWLEPGSFDVVLCADALEHLRFVEHALDRIREWLVPGGHFVVAVPNACHFSVLAALGLHRNWKYEDSGLFDRGHYRLFTRKSLLRLLSEHGFEVEETAGRRIVYGKARVLHLLLRPLFWLMPFLDDYLVYTWAFRAVKPKG